MRWFRLYHDLLNDPKVQELRPELFKAWINLLCLASSRDERGTLPSDDEIAFALRLRRPDAVRFTSEFRARNLLETRTDGTRIIHGWDARQRESDADKTANERQKRHRAKAVVTQVSRVTNGDVTPLDTDTDKKEIREEEKRITPPTPSRVTAVKPPRVEVKPRPRNPIFDALLTACDYGADSSLTAQEGARIGKAAAQIKAAGGTPDDVALRAVRYTAKYPGASLTPLALAGHWGELATAPRASPAVRDNRPVTFTEVRQENGAAAFAQVRAIYGGDDGVSNVRDGDDATVQRVEPRPGSGTDRRLLGAPADKQR